MNVEFGIRVPNSGPLTSVENMTRAAKEAEEMGFSTVWLHDHVVWSGEMHRHHISSGSAHAIREEQHPDFFESLTSLAYLAAHTKRVKLGVACFVMPCRNPIFLAKQTATVDHLTNGRLLVGIGLGSKASLESNEFEVFQVPFKRRAPLTDEYTEAMKAIWTQDRATFHGPTIQFTDAEIFPKPLQKPHPPIWVGGWTDKAAERTARLGDGWIPGWLSPSEMARGAEIVRRTATDLGRNPDDITIAVEKLASIAIDRETAMERALPTVRTSSKTYERDVDNIQFALDRHIFGSVDDVKRRVDEFVNAGVRHFELKLMYSTMDELSDQMELWAEHIIPSY